MGSRHLPNAMILPASSSLPSRTTTARDNTTVIKTNPPLSSLLLLSRTLTSHTTTRMQKTQSDDDETHRRRRTRTTFSRRNSLKAGVLTAAAGLGVYHALVVERFRWGSGSHVVVYIVLDSDGCHVRRDLPLDTFAYFGNGCFWETTRSSSPWKKIS